MRKYTQDEVYRYVKDTVEGYTKERMPYTFYSSIEVQNLLASLADNAFKNISKEVERLQKDMYEK